MDPRYRFNPNSSNPSMNRSNPVSNRYFHRPPSINPQANVRNSSAAFTSSYLGPLPQPRPRFLSSWDLGPAPAVYLSSRNLAAPHQPAPVPTRAVFSSKPYEQGASIFNSWTFSTAALIGRTRITCALWISSPSWALRNKCVFLRVNYRQEHKSNRRQDHRWPWNSTECQTFFTVSSFFVSFSFIRSHNENDWDLRSFIGFVIDVLTKCHHSHNQQTMRHLFVILDQPTNNKLAEKKFFSSLRIKSKTKRFVFIGDSRPCS